MTDQYRAGKRLWSPEEDAELRRCFPDEPTAVLAKRLRRTTTATSARAGMLGLHKSTAYLASPHACRLRRGDNVGARFRYPKGHVPANKGQRRPGFGPGRMKETQFKPGTLSGHAAQHLMPIGSTRLIDGYLYRKVSDTSRVPWTKNWTQEHYLIWRAAHGPIPPGHALKFANGNRLDIRLENLVLITRRALMAQNTVHNLPAPLPQTIQLLGALRRQIRKREGHATQQD